LVVNWEKENRGRSRQSSLETSRTKRVKRGGLGLKKKRNTGSDSGEVEDRA